MDKLKDPLGYEEYAGKSSAKARRPDSLESALGQLQYISRRLRLLGFTALGLTISSLCIFLMMLGGAIFTVFPSVTSIVLISSLFSGGALAIWIVILPWHQYYWVV